MRERPTNATRPEKLDLADWDQLLLVTWLMLPNKVGFPFLNNNVNVVWCIYALYTNKTYYNAWFLKTMPLQLNCEISGDKFTNYN